MEQSSGTSTQLGAEHTQARQSCSQHSSGRLSDVCCVGVCGGEGVGGGENVSHAVHAALGGCVMCVRGGGGGGVGAVMQSTPTLHKNSDTPHNESLSLSLSLSLLRESRDLVLTSLVSRRILARFRFSSPFRLFKKVAVCGDCLVTLSLTINETLKWLSSLHILIKESLWWWWECSDRYVIFLFPHLHPPFSPSLISLMMSQRVMKSSPVTCPDLAPRQYYVRSSISLSIS